MKSFDRNTPGVFMHGGNYVWEDAEDTPSDPMADKDDTHDPVLIRKTHMTP